jgi:hypothetical protein
MAPEQPAEHSGGDDEVKQSVVVASGVREQRVRGGEVVEARLNAEVQPAFGPPQLRCVRKRGVAAGPQPEPDQRIGSVAGPDGR